jgi:hypothetical protein
MSNSLAISSNGLYLSFHGYKNDMQKKMNTFLQGVDQHFAHFLTFSFYADPNWVRQLSALINSASASASSVHKTWKQLRT